MTIQVMSLSAFFQIVMTRTPSVEDGSKVDYVTAGSI